jgi:hypothetical protein
MWPRETIGLITIDVTENILSAIFGNSVNCGGKEPIFTFGVRIVELACISMNVHRFGYDARLTEKMWLVRDFCGTTSYRQKKHFNCYFSR